MIGGINGVLTGMTGSFVVPGVLYLQALALPRDAFIQAMGILFTISTVALAVSLGDRDHIARRFKGHRDGRQDSALHLWLLFNLAAHQCKRRLYNDD